MRYIAIFLLLANIGYFVWVQSSSEPASQPTASSSRPLLNTGLTLVSEFQEQLAARPALSCFTVAGFASTDDATSFIAEIDEIAYAARLYLDGDPLDSQYRVFIPPASSRGIATITLDNLSERLAALEIDVESYLITRGTLENGIALGVFSDRESAVTTLNAVQGLGYGPEIEEIPRSTGEIQVRLEMLRQDLLESPAGPDLTASRPDLTITENLCETIAQGTQFP
ncbi:MAG: hypothetical protein WDZ52_09685 [Pseudohongiellaceae bacterium]